MQGLPLLISLGESIFLYASRAAVKLGRQHSYAGTIYVFIQTCPFKEKEPQYGNCITIPLPTPSDDTTKLVKIALWGLKQIYRQGYGYAKAGIMLSELVGQFTRD